MKKHVERFSSETDEEADERHRLNIELACREHLNELEKYQTPLVDVPIRVSRRRQKTCK
jgi:hypothetical protein